MYHFISGLPRSGSTLLASILKQNPKLEASIMTPVGHAFTSLLTALGPDNEAGSYLNTARRSMMLRRMIDGFYYDAHPDVEVIFDNNRRWTANIAALAELYPDCKVLCCVRDPRAIVDSFERLFQENPLNMSAIYGGRANTTVYDRVAELMKPQSVLGYSMNALSSAFHGPENKRVLMIEYDDLCRFPVAVIQDIYKVIEQPMFPHRFDDIQPILGADEFDRRLHTPGLHDLKPEVVFAERQTILPPDLFTALPTPFWRLNELAIPGG